MNHKLSDFDFYLPENLIAQKPLSNRASSKMLVLDSKTGECEVKKFVDILDYLQPDDVMVFNDTKVIPARIFGKKVLENGEVSANIEILLLDEKEKNIWQAMLKPAKRVRVGTKIQISENEIDFFEVVNKSEDGTIFLKFGGDSLFKILDEVGHIPLPPYIKRADEESDKTVYQTVYAKNLGAVAAPTAGLHFTEEILQELNKKNVQKCSVTLHVGAGTFLPVKTENILEHKMHSERFELSAETAKKVNFAKQNGKRVIAVGTTSVRVLESCAENNLVFPQNNRTEIFIYPPYKPQIVNILLTNFHLPKSTLLMLVSAFAGRENILRAYELAIKEKFRFFSYGDCMLII